MWASLSGNSLKIEILKDNIWGLKSIYPIKYKPVHIQELISTICADKGILHAVNYVHFGVNVKNANLSPDKINRKLSFMES